MLVASSAALGGAVRYELPELLGEHRFDGSEDYLILRSDHVDTPFGYYTVERARLVVEGNVTSGRAHGDGIIREALDFELKPSVSAAPSFDGLLRIFGESMVGEFHIDQVYPNPFLPSTTPLPGPGGYPPISFYVTVSVSPAFLTDCPPLIEPDLPPHLLWPYGIIVDTPIVANITEAYIIMEGQGVVPEPSAWMLILAGTSAIILSRRLRRT